MITVRLPSALLRRPAETVTVEEPVATIGDLVEILGRRVPGFRGLMEDALYNFAVNDEMVLHGVRQRALRDGDVVEVLPVISGGARAPLPRRA